MHSLRPIDRQGDVPAHKQIRSELLRYIEDAGLQEGDRLPGESEIAERFAVSRMTANKAILSLVTDGVLTREKGKGTFIANLEKTVASCGVAIMPENLALAMEDYYFGSLYWQVHQHCDSHEVPVQLMHLDRSLAWSRQKGEGLIVINPSRDADETLRRICQHGGRVVVLGATLPGASFTCIDSDNFLGASLAINHLVDLGHRQIAFIGACVEDSNSQDRLRGYRGSLKGRGIPVDPGLEFWMADAISWDDEEAERLLQAIQAGVSAVFAAGPHLAMKLIAMCRRQGIRIPEECSIVAFDDPSFFQMADPPLTTIRQPLAEMAQAACEALWDPAPIPQPTQVFDPQLIVRESTAAPRTTIHCQGTS